MSSSRKQIIYEDIVHDESRIRAQAPQPDFSWILSNVIPPRKRSLYPSRPSTVQTKSKHLQEQSRMVVTVISATNTPHREETAISNITPFLTSPPTIHRLSSMNAPSSHRLIESQTIRRQQGLLNQSEITTNKGVLNPIVQFKFCGITYETPFWQKIFEIPLPFDKESGCTPLKLKELEQSLEVAIFDRVEVDIGKGGGYYDDESTIFTERRFLGNLKVPLSAILYEEKQQGLYTLNVPDIVLGYAKRGGGASNESVPSKSTGRTYQYGTETRTRTDDVESQIKNNTAMSNHVRRKKMTSLNMMLTMKPSIPLRDTPDITLPSNESSTMLEYAMDWMQRYTRNNPRGRKRRVSLLVNGSNRKQNLITRFLCPQIPPPECQASLNQCAYYVSLIPFRNNWKALKSYAQHKIWLTSKRVIDVIAADWNERAALLANYFMYMSHEGIVDPFEVFLVVGFSVTEGNVVSVYMSFDSLDKEVVSNT